MNNHMKRRSVPARHCGSISQIVIINNKVLSSGSRISCKQNSAGSWAIDHRLYEELIARCGMAETIYHLCYGSVQLLFTKHIGNGCKTPGQRLCCAVFRQSAAAHDNRTICPTLSGDHVTDGLWR